MVGAAEVDEVLEACLPTKVWEQYRERGLGTVLARYVELLERWNRVVGLTAVRDGREMVRRHVGEGLCCAVTLPACGTLLDLGSGAGLPGVPVQLMRPELEVTLAEAQGRKAAFLREVVRELGLPARVHGGRAQELQKRSFECVCLRAVDPMGQALDAASELASRCVCVLGSPAMAETYGARLDGWELRDEASTVGSGSTVYLYEPALSA